MSILDHNDNEAKAIIGATKDKLVLLYFWSNSCAPCKQFAPILESIAVDLSDKVRIIKINIDKDEELAQKYMVRSLPTIIALKNSIIEDTKLSVSTKTDFVTFIKSCL